MRKKSKKQDFILDYFKVLTFERVSDLGLWYKPNVYKKIRASFFLQAKIILLHLFRRECASYHIRTKIIHWSNVVFYVRIALIDWYFPLLLCRLFCNIHICISNIFNSSFVKQRRLVTIYLGRIDIQNTLD
jgi:hypothetical protein